MHVPKKREETMTVATIGAGLLVVGGLIQALPPVSNKLTETLGGKPILQVLIGIVSLIVGVTLISQTL